MDEYRIRLVGEPMGAWQTVEAISVYAAVAEVAGCKVDDVCLSISRSGEWTDDCPGAERFMPRDWSGRQWEVAPLGDVGEWYLRWGRLS